MPGAPISHDEIEKDADDAVRREEQRLKRKSKQGHALTLITEDLKHAASFPLPERTEACLTGSLPHYEDAQRSNRLPALYLCPPAW